MRSNVENSCDECRLNKGFECLWTWLFRSQLKELERKAQSYRPQRDQELRIVDDLGTYILAFDSGACDSLMEAAVPSSEIYGGRPLARGCGRQSD